jgi:hypothetical protein|tara:strand:+ start:1377 stop:1514 length:138 start_codon:yes stop_codon:yes gene_type:complete
MSEGKILLELFRDEQKENNSIGCMCDECIEDMEKALKRFKVLDKK